MTGTEEPPIDDWAGYEPAFDPPEPKKIEPKTAKGTEDRVASEFSARYGDSLKYDHSAEAWYQWTNAHWVKLEMPIAMHMARILARELGGNGKSSFVAGAERFAKADPMHAVTADIWDNDPMLLGTPTGTINLRTGQQHRAKPEYMITRMTGCSPKSGTPEKWITFLNEVTGDDQGVIDYLQRLFGYCLTGDISEQALAFFHGPGGNGKGVFLNVMRSIMGTYAVTASMETFTASKHDRHPTDLAMLAGARLVTASETEAGRSWNQQRITNITGADPITARFMRKDFFTYIPKFKLIIIGNYAPRLQHVDEAMKRRFNLVPFNRKPKVKNLKLQAELMEEAPMILAWALQGCLEWQKVGLVPPNTITDATSDYFDDQDLFGQWIEDRCVTGKDATGREYEASSGQLFNAWREYAKEAAQYDKTGTTSDFAEAMEKRGFVRFRKKAMRGFKGIKLLTLSDGPQFDNHETLPF